MNPQYVPRINANDDEAELVFCYVSEGDWVESGQDLADFETIKATMTVQAQGSGYLRLGAKLRQRLFVGQVFAWLRPQPLELEEPGVQAPADDLPASGLGPRRGLRLSAAARQWLEKHSLPTPEVSGLGLLTLADLQDYGNGSQGSLCESQGSLCESQGTLPLARAKEAEIAALSAQPGALPSSLTVVVPACHWRGLPDKQVRLLQAIAQTVSQNPRLTAYFDKDKIRLYNRVDLGVALDLGKGLKVVTVVGADQMELADWKVHWEDLLARYLDNQLLPEELCGSTVTVTDLSGYDIYQFQPLLNGRQSLIVGVGGDKLLPQQPLTLTATFDHRVLTGREVAEFLQQLKTLMQDSPEPACDRCLIGLEEYYGSLARDAQMKLYLRPDGSQGMLCHVCASGY